MHNNVGDRNVLVAPQSGKRNSTEEIIPYGKQLQVLGCHVWMKLLLSRLHSTIWWIYSWKKSVPFHRPHVRGRKLFKNLVTSPFCKLSWFLFPWISVRFRWVEKPRDYNCELKTWFKQLDSLVYDIQYKCDQSGNSEQSKRDTLPVNERIEPDCSNPKGECPWWEPAATQHAQGERLLTFALQATSLFFP